MAPRDKRIEAMRRNPRAVVIDDLRAALESLGFACRNHGSSHVVFSHPRLRANLSIPAHRPYVQAERQALQAITDVEADEATEQAKLDVEQQAESDATEKGGQA